MAWMRMMAVLASMTVAHMGCTHSQRPERRVYVISEEPRGVGGSGHDYCANEQIVCFDRCWNSRPPLTSIKMGSGKHHEYCTTKCLEEYMECIEEEQEARGHVRETLRFTNIDRALGWLKEHQTEVVIGTLVVVAGVTFVVATGGSGALILAPLL